MRQHALHQSQDVLHQTHTAAHPAHRSGKLDGVAAQLIGSRHQTRRLLGSRYDLFLEPKLHRSWPGGGCPARAVFSLQVDPPRIPCPGNRQVSSTVHGRLDLPTATRFLPSSQSFRRRPMRRNAYYEDPARSGSPLAPVRAASHSRRREHPPHRLPGGVGTAFPWVCRSRRGTASQTESKD